MFRMSSFSSKNCILLLLLLLALTSAANAHFRLTLPYPRGPVNYTTETEFCGGYPNPAYSRMQFPPSGGFFIMAVADHSDWTVGVMVSSGGDQVATSFGNFSLVNGYSAGRGVGNFCIPLDFATSNVTGLQSGQNVTVQVVFNGGDGILYQCSDITLNNNVKLSSVIACSNTSSSGSGYSSGGSFPAASLINFWVMAGLVASLLLSHL